MSTLQRAVSDLSVVLSNPASGGGSSLNFNEASELLNILSVAGEGDLDACSELIYEMAEQGRGPNPAEWSWLRGLMEEPLEEEAPTTEPTVEVEENTTGGEDSDREEERLDSAEGAPV